MSRSAAISAATIAALCAAVLPPCRAASAADVEPPPAPNRQLTLVSPLGGYAIMGLAAAGLVGISLIRARRGEQD
jgi:hypothetical protein